MVPPESAEEFVAAYREATADLPGAVLHQTFLVTGEHDEWRIVTQWRSRAHLEAYRRSVDTPVAVALFRRAGVEPIVTEFEIAHHATAHHATPAGDHWGDPSNVS